MLNQSHQDSDETRSSDFDLNKFVPSLLSAPCNRVCQSGLDAVMSVGFVLRSLRSRQTQLEWGDDVTDRREGLRHVSLSYNFRVCDTWQAVEGRAPFMPSGISAVSVLYPLYA